MRIEGWWYKVPLRLRSLFQRRTVESELDEELQFHLDALIEQHVARGLAEADARTAALRALGGIEWRKEEIRDTRGTRMIENLARDLRHAGRGLRRAPGFAVVAILTLAIGLGACTAIFTVVESVLLRPLPYADSARLAFLEYLGSQTFAPAPVLHVQAEATSSFERIGAAQSRSPTLTGLGAPEQVPGIELTSEVLPMLGVAPLIGRTFTSDEARDGGKAVVVISYRFWQQHLDADPAVIGRTLVLDGTPRQVIGVMPQGFDFAPFWATHRDVYMPLVLGDRINDWDGASLRVFARLRPGVSIARANAELATIGVRLHQLNPEFDPHISTRSLRDKVVGSVAKTLWVLLGAVGFVLLIACANVAHLLLMRAAARARESAVRASLGASRARLVQQSLVESLAIALLGAIGGYLLAGVGVHALVALAPPDLPRFETIHTDTAVFLFMLGIATTAGVLSGLIPALALARTDPNTMLRASGRGAGETRGRRRISAGLVASEFAIAVVLLAGAGLMIRTVAAMLHVDTGYDPHGVLSMQVAIRGTPHDSLARRGPFYDELIRRVQAIPGVVSASAINHLPLHGDYWRFTFFISGRPYPPPSQRARAYFRVVRPGYFQTMRIPLLRGRDITVDDISHRNAVVVLDERAAAYWPNGDAVGQRITVTEPDKPPEWYTVIGVVKSVQQAEWVGQRSGEMYYPQWDAVAPEAGGIARQLHPSYMTLVARTAGPPRQLLQPIRKVVQELDPDAPIADVMTMDEALAEQLAEPRFYLMLLGSFAATALVLAAIGVYGVISYAVGTRQREIGIRMALGAARTVPLRLVIGEGIRLAVIGAVIGVIGAGLLTRYLQALLFEVTPLDPLTFALAPTALVAVALLACAIPARRASRVDPAVVLRGD